MGVLGGKNNSQKYLSSDQAWYNVTWDDGSKAQVVLVDLTGRASEPLAGSLGDPPVQRGAQGASSLDPEVSLVSMPEG